MFKRVVTSAVLAISLAATGAGAAEKVVAVKIDDADVRIPLPEGMCEPTGPFLAAAKQAADLDTANDTFVTAFDCDLLIGKSTAIRYAILKRPKSSQGQSIDLGTLLAEYRADPDTFQKGLNVGANSDEVKDMLEPVMPSDAEMSAGLKAVGSDSDGVYISGVARIENGPDGFSAIAMGTALTAVKRKMVVWTVYAVGDSPAVVDEQLRLAKAAAKALLKAN